MHDVYVLFLSRAGARITARCHDYGIDASEPVLLVMACSEGPRQLAAAVARWGERPLVAGKDGAFAGVIRVLDESLTGFARQYPDRLIAKAATGLPAPRDEHGNRPIIWADLGDETPVDVGDPRARAS